MQIQLNTDKNIEGTENMEAYFKERLEQGLQHFREYITRLEVHVSDQNADKEGADDIQCRIEARVRGQKPVLVESRADNQEAALNGAIDKIQGVMRKVKGKMKDY
jgi:ribosomal subunit interface protein